MIRAFARGFLRFFTGYPTPTQSNPCASCLRCKDGRDDVPAPADCPAMAMAASFTSPCGGVLASPGGTLIPCVRVPVADVVIQSRGGEAALAVCEHHLGVLERGEVVDQDGQKVIPVVVAKW